MYIIYVTLVHRIEARLIRNNILNVFTTSYKLKTLPTGALVRAWYVRHIRQLLTYCYH